MGFNRERVYKLYILVEGVRGVNIVSLLVTEWNVTLCKWEKVFIAARKKVYGILPMVRWNIRVIWAIMINVGRIWSVGIKKNGEQR